MTPPVPALAPLPDDRPCVVALSGGADSATLLSLVAARHHDVRAVHVHHHLRASAHRDVGIARAQCAQAGVRLRVVHLDGGALRRSPMGVSAAARDARYAALADEARTDGAFVVTAHTADDRLETVWMRMAQGCGLAALGGPARHTVIHGADVIRPMLGWWRSDVEASVRALGWTVAHDPTNADRARLRAVVRHEVLPALRDAIGSSAPLLRTLGRLQDDATAYLALLDDELRRTSRATSPTATRSDEIVLCRRRLHEMPRALASAVVHHALRRIGARPDEAFVHRIVASLSRGHAHLDGPGTAVEVDEAGVCLRRVVGRGMPVRPATARDVHIPLVVPPGEGTATTRVPGGMVDVWRASAPSPDPAALVEWFDTDGLTRPLFVVRPAVDDPFTPFGGDRSRRLGEVLRSDGARAADRRRALAVRCGHDILLVLGHRRGALAPITAATRHAIAIRWRPDASLPPLEASLG